MKTVRCPLCGLELVTLSLWPQSQINRLDRVRHGLMLHATAVHGRER